MMKERKSWKCLRKKEKIYHFIWHDSICIEMISFKVKTQVTYQKGSWFCYALSNWINSTYKTPEKKKTINFNPNGNWINSCIYYDIITCNLVMLNELNEWNKWKKKCQKHFSIYFRNPRKWRILYMYTMIFDYDWRSCRNIKLFFFFQIARGIKSFSY